MKRLTVNRIASAGLRANRRTYIGLAVGIFLSVFLITSLCLLVQGVVLARDERVHARMGRQDAFFLDGTATDAELLNTGFFTEEIGHVYVMAKVQESEVHLGFYDETGAAILNRSLVEGRMPEQPGEIALEQSALELLRRSEGVGDALTLMVEPIDGVAEERTYTIVGILKEQTPYLDVMDNIQSSRSVLHWPSILTCAEEAPFATGRIAQHRLLMLSPGTLLYTTLQYGEKNHFGDGIYVGMLDDGSWVSWVTVEALLGRDENTQLTIVLISLLGGALLLATVIGIAGAMEGQLGRKTEQIAMLRAVGATKRQIRRIFGRESWLLALLIAPPSVAAGCLLAWCAARLLPDYVIFRAAPVVLIPILLLTMLVILLASSLPLRRAASTTPMATLRDTSMLRKTKRIRSQAAFRVPQLIARRQLMLHPTRQFGSILLVAMLVLTIALASTLAVYLMNGEGSTVDEPEFTMSMNTQSRKNFASLEPMATLTRGDVNQLRTLPLVKDVELRCTGGINLLVDEVPSYFTPNHFGGVYRRLHLITEENGDFYGSAGHRDAVEEHNQVRALLGTEKSLVPLELLVLTITPDDLPAELVSGEIDMEALNAGREVLVYAPDFYYKDSNDGGYRVSTWDDGKTEWDVVDRNDYFTAGQEIDLTQLWMYDHNDALLRPYDEAQRVDATVKVGAVLAGKGDQMWETAVITTEQGMEALGLKANYITSLQVYLSAMPDSEGEEALEQRIASIAMRGGMSVTNQIARSREREMALLYTALVFAAVAIILFAVAVGMISGSITRRIRADVRMIGTLRAVGADSRAICRCYSGNVWIALVIGAVLGLLLDKILEWTGLISYDFIFSLTQPIILAAEAVFISATALTCQLLARLRIREIMRCSIVENIREL